MKLEKKCLIIGMINNFVISLIKILGGLIFNLSSLFADGLHTFSDFITDIISFMGMKIANKKSTKTHPFGFGKIEYIVNFFIGFLIFCLGIFIIYNAFKSSNNIIPPLKILIILSIAILLKLIIIIYMSKIGNKINSQILLTSVKESKMDLISSVGVVIITILLQFSNKIDLLKYSDLVGSILIGLLIIKTSIDILKENVLSLIGEREVDKDIINNITSYINEYENVEVIEINLMKYGSYYKAELILDFDSKLFLRRVINLERKITHDHKLKKRFNIKYINIFINTSNN